MKYLRKFLENIKHNDKEQMLEEFEEVFGFNLYSLSDRFLEFEDNGLDFTMLANVWIKVESNKKYNLSHTVEFPDKSSYINSYVNQLFRYRTESNTEDNLELLEFQRIDKEDIVSACLVLFVRFPNITYHEENYEEKEKYMEIEFDNLIGMIKRQFPLVDIPDTRKELSEIDLKGIIFKRKVD